MYRLLNLEHLEKFSLNFSSSLFVVRVNLLHPQPSMFRYGVLFLGYASINVKPEGGPPGICGAFDRYRLPRPREFDLEPGSLSVLGSLLFSCTEEWDQVTSPHVLVCALAILELE